MSKGYLEEIGVLDSIPGPVAQESGSAPSVPKDSVPAAAPVKELSPEELAKLSKEERKAYHEARRAAQPQPAAKKQLTKAERREEQEAQRKAKEEKTKKVGNDEELLAELKLQGLNEDQAREMAKEMQQGEKLEGDDDDEGEGEDLGASVARWMSEQEEITKESLRDFNMKVRWQGHVNTLPADHLGCILKILFKDACASCDLSGKLPPTAVAEKLKAPLARWAPVLEPMYRSIDDVMLGPDCVCSAATEAVNEAVQASNGTEAAGAAAIVGCYMALREDDILPDEELLMGCRRISSEHPSTVLEKFVEFLEDALEDDSDEDEDE